MLKSSVASKWTSKHPWGNIYFAGDCALVDSKILHSLIFSEGIQINRFVKLRP